jgi:hypothetical protein
MRVSQLLGGGDPNIQTCEACDTHNNTRRNPNGAQYENSLRVIQQEQRVHNKDIRKNRHLATEQRPLTLKHPPSNRTASTDA